MNVSLLQSTQPCRLCAVRSATSPLLQKPFSARKFTCRTKQMVSTRASAGGAFPVPEAYAKEASVDLSNGTFKDNGSAGTAGNGASKPADDVSGAMLEPSAFNKNWVRLAWVSAAVIIAARSTEFVPVKVAALVHVLAWGLWLGSNIWTTFAVGITMFKNMPRQMFGRVQAKLFPQYFATATAAIVLQMGTLAFGTPTGIARAQLITLGVALLTGVANWLYIEPVATDLMFERYALENAEGERDGAKIKALYKQFGKFHGISSLLNLVGLGAAVGHGWWLATRLSIGLA
ncbi:g2731 [Coccomyxa viridis]|uniref:G2731 protein n=1 Tax=Coccomyxa viridis TaxID=1274662 RepID=A0ABP1FT21_9CHLO